MEKITIGLLDRDWCQLNSAIYYAQRGEVAEFGFGRTTSEALGNLESREAALQPKFDLELAEEAAFLALGAASYLHEEQKGRSLDAYGGYLGFISEVVSLVPILIHRWRRFPEGEFSGVWLYDVTERFGREWAQALLEGDVESPQDVLEYIISDELQKWDVITNGCPTCLER